MFCICCIPIAVQVEVEGGKGGEGEKDDERGREEGGERRKEELFWILDSDEMKGVPVVVLANKQDLPNACSSSEVAAKIGLQQVRTHHWFIQGTCAVSGDGLLEAMTELGKLVKEFKKSRR